MYMYICISYVYIYIYIYIFVRVFPIVINELVPSAELRPHSISHWLA